MTNKLSLNEIENVKGWIKKKGYIHYDVQYEILDHVVSAIENKRMSNPNINLETAFMEVHSTFGIFGFSSIEESFKKGLQIKFRKRFMSSIFLQFTDIQFLIIHFFLITLFISLYSFFHEYSHIWMTVIFIVFPITLLLIIKNKQNKRHHLKPFLTFNYVNNVNFFIAICPSIANFAFNVSRHSSLTPELAYISFIAILFIFTTLFIANKLVSDFFLIETEKMYELYGKL